MKAHSVTVVRPYGERIRKKMYAQLSRASLQVGLLIEAGIADAEAIQRIRQADNRILLVPFHGHRTLEGETLDGFSLLRQLRASGPYGFRVLMPVSPFAAAAASLAASDRSDPELNESILWIRETELDQLELAARIRSHIDP